jgi:NAD-dependent deacetylase
MMPDFDEQAVCWRVRTASSVLVVTGAGVSVASGLPTYRGDEDSLYSDPQALASAFGNSLRRDPVAFWATWKPRRALFRVAEPNDAHKALARLERLSRRFFLATQNVDDLHRKAGSRSLAELHGNALAERCLDDTCPQPAWPSRPETDAPAAPIPTCPRCGSIARPDVVLFGEGDDARLEPVRHFLRQGVGAVLLIGTSGVVTTPQAIVEEARRHGKPWVVEIGPRPSPELRELVDVSWVGKAEKVVRLLTADLLQSE